MKRITWVLLVICIVGSVSALEVLDPGYIVEPFVSFSVSEVGYQRGLVADAEGNLYFTRSEKIDKITPEGIRSTITTGLGNPQEIVWGGGTGYGDYIYLSHNYGNNVLRIDPLGNKTQFAPLPEPIAITIDRSGVFGNQLYVGTRFPFGIYSISEGGLVEPFVVIPTLTDGLALDIEIDPTGAYGNAMYASIYSPTIKEFRGVFAIDPLGNMSRMVNLPSGGPNLEFDSSANNAFGGYLYYCTHPRILKVYPNGTSTNFIESDKLIVDHVITSDGIMYVIERTPDNATFYITRISVDPVRPLLVGLEVVGIDEVSEDFQIQYRAIAHYENNGTKDVTYSAEWFVSPNDNCSIAGGVLTTNDIDFPEDVTITARYSEGENVQEAFKDVSILAVCPGGYALDFDGSSDYVDLGQTPELKVPFPLTVMGWVNVTEEGLLKNNHLLRIGGGGLGFVVAYSGIIDILFDGASGGRRKRSNTLLEAGRWYHIAGVIRGPEDMDMDIYINATDDGGSYDGTGGDIVYGDDISTIGSNDGGRRGFFNGMMDDLRLYDEALSQEEIQIAMFGGDTTVQPIGHWEFDEGDGQDVADSSVNGYDGKLGSTPGDDDNDPEWVESGAPVNICSNVGVDIRPGSCPNLFNVASRGVLSVAVLGSAEFDVGTIDPSSIFLEGAPAIRSGYKDVAGAVPGSDECGCSKKGKRGDGYIDLTVKFRIRDIVEKLLEREGELEKGQRLVLSLSGQLRDNGDISGYDCVVLVGNVPRHLMARGSDINGDGVINVLDLAKLSEYWLESVNVQ